MKRQLVFYILFLLMVSFMRVLPHPVGCSPLIAASLFIYSTSENKRVWLLALPLFFLATAALSTGLFWFWWIQPVSLVIVLLASSRMKKRGIGSYLGLGVFSSCLFFLVSNTGAFFAQALPYSMTISGWVECLDMGIPYFRPQLMWDTLFTVGIFYGYELLARPYQKFTLAIKQV